jgi:hypothetical protein
MTPKKINNKKIKKFDLIFILFVILLTILCGCFENNKLTENGYHTLEGLGYINEVLMYGFNPAEGFYLREESILKQYAAFEYVPYANEFGQLGLYIYASNVSANISFPNRSIKEIAEELQESLVNSTSYTLYLNSYNFKTINQMDFYEVLFESPIQQLEDRSIFWKYIYVVKDDRMLNIQIISSSELFEKYIDDIDQSLSSLVILKLEEDKWNLEKYYNKKGELNNTIIMNAREYYEDKSVVLYYSNINIFYNSSNQGDIIIIQDNISNLYYDEISNTTTISFNWDKNGSIGNLYFLFEGDITNSYKIGDKVNITVTLIRVNFTHKNINYDLELYAESWISEEYFKENLIKPSDISKALRPLKPHQIEKL